MANNGEEDEVEQLVLFGSLQPAIFGLALTLEDDFFILKKLNLVILVCFLFSIF